MDVSSWMETLEKSENSSLQNRDTVSQNFSQMYENVNKQWNFYFFHTNIYFSDNKRNLEEKSKDKDVE